MIAAILLERHLQNVANYLILSLAVADLLVAVLVMPLGAVYEVGRQAGRRAYYRIQKVMTLLSVWYHSFGWEGYGRSLEMAREGDMARLSEYG